MSELDLIRLFALCHEEIYAFSISDGWVFSYLGKLDGLGNSCSL